MYLLYRELKAFLAKLKKMLYIHAYIGSCPNIKP
jgi:hypothetical protein